ncbi:MAG: polyprenol monophosphomannose synthase [Bacteroidota bacterium]
MIIKKTLSAKVPPGRLYNKTKFQGVNTSPVSTGDQAPNTLDTDAVVIIPTYNEKENITLLIDAILALSIPLHILVVDDASPDGTSSQVAKCQACYPRRVHLMTRTGSPGLGAAYIDGFKWALQRDYSYILTMDADFSHHPDDLLRLYTYAKEAPCDLVIGSRYVRGINVVNWPMRRILLSYVANQFARCITGLPIMDTTAGFYCYSRKVLAAIHLDEIQSAGYGFQVEMKFLAWKYGFRLQEIPIVFTDRIRGHSKMSGTTIAEALGSVIRMKIRSLFHPFHSEVSAG